MRNIQRRAIPAPVSTAGKLIDDLADPRRSVWPSHAWPRMVLDDGLRVGSRGGHGPIRYRVVAYEPGRRLCLAFAPECGLQGRHELSLVEDGPGRVALVHTITATTHGGMRVLWPLVVRWFHEALIADLFDNAERQATGDLQDPPARWSAWVRLNRRLASQVSGSSRHGRRTVPAGPGRRD